MAFDALNIGVSGLNAYQSWIDMLSNNIANTATVGFKGQRMTFADQFYQQVQAGTGPSQTQGGTDPQDFGLGVKVNTVDTQFGQGGQETTGVNTDMMISGDGFFVLRSPNGSGTPTYTRDGAFSLNSNGLLYDPASGLAVQGYMANSSGQITQTGTPADINIPIGLTEQATATGAGVKVGPNSSDQVFDMQLGGNLDQTQWQQQYLNQIGSSPTAGTAKTISTTIYDSLGNAHQATITYTPDCAGASAAKAGPPPVPATNGLPTQVDNAAGVAVTPATRWSVSVTFTDGTKFNAIQKGGDVTGGAYTPPGFTATPVASGTIGYVYFDQNGQFINSSSIETAGPGDSITGGGAAPYLHATGNQPSLNNGNQLNVAVWGTGLGNNPTTGAPAPATGPIGLDFSENASLAGTSTASVISQNGYAAGTLSNISVGQDGTIVGSFTNGQNKTIAQLALATFQNEQGLQRMGGNQFAQTAASGLAQLGTAASGRYGNIVDGALEQSNVNLGDQFTKLIVAQRAFEANSRGITTADQNLITLENLRASEN